MLVPLICFVAAQAGAEPPTVALKLPSAPAAPGTTIKATLTVSFASGLHAYQNPASSADLIPVEVKLKKGSAKLIKVAYPAGVDYTTAGETKPIKVYSGDISIPITLKIGTKAGPIVLEFSYQECNDTACFPPSTVDATAIVKFGKKRHA